MTAHMSGSPLGPQGSYPGGPRDLCPLLSSLLSWSLPIPVPSLQTQVPPTQTLHHREMLEPSDSPRCKRPFLLISTARGVTLTRWYAVHYLVFVRSSAREEGGQESGQGRRKPRAGSNRTAVAGRLRQDPGQNLARDRQLRFSFRKTTPTFP